MAVPYPPINDTPPLTQAVAGLNQFIYSTTWTANVASDILVYSRLPNIPANDITQLINPTNYTVQFIGSDNLVQVTFNALENPPQFNIVTIVRNTPADWLNNYTNTNFLPSMLNSDFDTLTLVDQQTQLWTQIVPHYNYSEVLNNPIDLILPILGANQLWVKNSTNTAFIAADIADLPAPFAPDDAPFVTYSPDADLTNAFNLGSLGNGILAQNVASLISTPYILSLPLGVSFGGTGDSTFTPYSVLCAGTTNSSALQNVSGLGTSGQVLASNGASALPSWQSIADITASPLTEINDTNISLTLGGTPATALLEAVSITAGWIGQLSVPRGGTGDASFTAYSLLCGGTTSTGPLQNVAGIGSSGQILTSNGTASLPSWQNAPAVVTPAALTEVNDTNVTLTLGGTPATSLLQPVSITVGWTGDLAVARGGTGVGSVTTVPAATSFAGWDSNKNLAANNILSSLTTTVSSGSTIILTVTSTQVQNVTGTTAQTVQMPFVTTLPATPTTTSFILLNNTTATMTVVSSGSNTIGTIPAGNSATINNILYTGTTAASWFMYVPGFTPSAFTAANDTNVTATLTGFPTVALLEPLTFTLGWTGQLALIRGGTNSSLTASNGGIVYSNASQLAILNATTTAQQLLVSGASTAPQWTTSTYPLTNAINTLLYASSANTMAALATANNGVLFTSASGVPSIGTAPIAAGGTAVTSVTIAPTATSFAGWDANKNLSANSLIEGYSTTATAAGTTTLTVGSPYLNYFTGSTTQVVVLPVTSTLVLGQQFFVANNSSGVVTVQSSGLNNIVAMAANTVATFTCILTTGTTAASWSSDYNASVAGVNSITGTANQVNASSSTGAVVISLPQSIATASTPTFAGIILPNSATSFKGLANPTVQKFLSGSGTYTTPTNPAPLYIRVGMVGGGAGGGASGTTPGTANAGGNTTFGTSLLVANGGGAGNIAAGGTASLGSGPIGIALQGGQSSPAGNLVNGVGGVGASSFFGGAGVGDISGQVGGTAITNSGSGGGGGGGFATGGSGFGGSAGGYIDAIISSPLTTYAYSVGAGGAGQTAGTGGVAGGPGGSGAIYVTEYYQ